MSLTTKSTKLTVEADSEPTSIGIVAPVDSQYPASALRVLVTGLPSDGTVYLADRVTPVLPNELLTVAELSGLTFAGGSNASGQSATFTYR